MPIFLRACCLHLPQESPSSNRLKQEREFPVCSDWDAQGGSCFRYGCILEPGVLRLRCPSSASPRPLVSVSVCTLTLSFPHLEGKVTAGSP